MPLTQLLSIATAVPANRLTQEEAAEHAVLRCDPAAGRFDALRELYRRSGVRSRHSAIIGPREDDFYPPADLHGQRGPGTGKRMAAYEDLAGGLAARASLSALQGAATEAEAVTHLVTVSCTGFRSPGVDIELIQDLGLRPTVQRTHVGFMGCHGAINGLRVAASITAADPGALVLLCAVELCTLHFAYGGEARRIVANALFADGAAAALLGGSDFETSCPPRESAWRLVATGSSIFPGSTGDMTWRIGDHGFEMTLSPRVPSLIRRHLRPWLDEWLKGENVRVDEVGSWALHPGGPRILAEVAETLELEREATAASREVLTECGNMSSPTVLFILQRLQQQHAERPCVMLAFGPGLTAEGALLV